MAKIEVQTKKANTKDCACTYPGCDVICRVNMFYAPAKARCSEHKRKGAPKNPDGFIKPAEVVSVEEIDVPPPQPNYSLRDLRCPFCGETMEIIALHEGLGHVDFACMNGTCWCVVGVRAKWRPMVLRRVPEHLRPLVKAFKEEQLLEPTFSTVEDDD